MIYNLMKIRYKRFIYIYIDFFILHNNGIFQSANKRREGDNFTIKLMKV